MFIQLNDPDSPYGIVDLKEAVRLLKTKKRIPEDAKQIVECSNCSRCPENCGIRYTKTDGVGVICKTHHRTSKKIHVVYPQRTCPVAKIENKQKQV